MSNTRVASRYAQALLDLAIEQNKVDKIHEDMKTLSETCNDSKDLVNLIKSPIIDPKKKIQVFEAIFDSVMDEMSINFIALITKNSREKLLQDIAESFIQLYKKHKNIIDVELTSATALEKSVKDKIIAKVKANFEGIIELHEKVDPSLIGGFVVRIDDQQLDASIASQLANLKNILLN